MPYCFDYSTGNKYYIHQGAINDLKNSCMVIGKININKREMASLQANLDAKVD